MMSAMGAARVGWIGLVVAVHAALATYVVVGAAARVQAQQPSGTDDQRASVHLQQGRAYIEQSNWEAAVTEFEAAYRLRPHPRVAFNIGQSYERLLRYGRARDAYARVVATAPEGDADRAAAEERILALDVVLAVLVVRTNAPRAQVWVDGVLEGTAPGDVRVSSGRRRIEVRAPGYVPEATEIDVAAQARTDVRLRMTRLARGGGGTHPALFFTAAGLAVAAGATGAVLGVRALDLSDQYESSPRRTREQQSEGETTALLADVMIVGAGVMAVTATVLLFTTDWGDDDDEGDASDGAPSGGTAARAQVAPWIGDGTAGIAIGGVLP